MNTVVSSNTRWSTSSYGEAADTSPVELSALGEHLDICKQCSGRMFKLQCLAETVHGFMAARLVTTLTLLVLAIAAASLFL